MRRTSKPAGALLTPFKSGYMAVFRKVHTTFWTDSFVSELTNDQKLFYLYILTNDRTTQCGIYEITKRQIAFDLGCSIDTVSKHLKYFIDTKKIRYNEATNEIALKNWPKFNESTSPKVQACVNKELIKVKDRVLIEYLYSIDTNPQEEKEKEKEKEEEKEEEQEQETGGDGDFQIVSIFSFEEFWELYDKKTGSKSKLQKKWEKIKEEDRVKIKDHIPLYKMAQPEKQYRKNPETYLNNESWNDEIIFKHGTSENRTNSKESTSWAELAEVCHKHFGNSEG